MTGRLEKSAINTAKVAPKGAARGSSVDFSWASSPEEHRALAKHVLVLVSVVTQDAAELPLRRVYVNIDGRETELVRLSSQLSGVRKGSKTYSMLGPYREDGFYLAPAGTMMADGYLQADFAVRRNGFNLYKLPGTPPDFIKADSNPMPAARRQAGNAGAQGDAAARVQGLRIARRPALERFPAKWTPVRVKKTRQNKNLEPFPFRFHRNGKGSSCAACCIGYALSSAPARTSPAGPGRAGSPDCARAAAG